MLTSFKSQEQTHLKVGTQSRGSKAFMCYDSLVAKTVQGILSYIEAKFLRVLKVF